MDTWVWIVIGVVVLAIIIAAIVAASKKSKQRKVEQDRENRTRAAELRQQGQEEDLAAREREADAAAADARAQKARVEAERLEQEADARTSDARSVRGAADDHLRTADELDPEGRAGSGPGTGAVAAGGAAGGTHEASTDREHDAHAADRGHGAQDDALVSDPDPQSTDSQYRADDVTVTDADTTGRHAAGGEDRDRRV